MKKTKETTPTITIRIGLVGGHACEFIYTDAEMAHEHYLQLSAQMTFMGQIIKHIDLVK
jgi:hypothetical protein